MIHLGTLYNKKKKIRDKFIEFINFSEETKGRYAGQRRWISKKYQKFSAQLFRCSSKLSNLVEV